MSVLRFYKHDSPGDWGEITNVAGDHVNCRCDALSPCRRSCPWCQAVMRGHSCPCQHKPVETPLRTALPRKSWRYTAYHEVGNHPEKPKDSASNFERALDKIIAAFDISPLELGVVEKPKKHYVYAAGYGYIEATAIPPGFSGNTVSEALKYATEATMNRTITPRELSNLLKEPRSPFFEAMREKHDNDVLALLKNGVISANEARCHLGLPEPLRPIKDPNGMAQSFADKPTQPGMLAMADIDRLLKSMWNDARTEPNSMLVGLSDYERLQHGASNPWEGLREILGDSFNTKENLDMFISNDSVQGLVNQARDLAKDGKTNLDSVKTAIDAGKAEYKERIVSALKGVVNLAKIRGPRSRRFLVAFWKNNQEYVLEGIDFAYGQTIKEEDENSEGRVFVEGEVYPASDGYYTMKYLKKELEDCNLPYVIEYFD